MENHTGDVGVFTEADKVPGNGFPVPGGSAAARLRGNDRFYPVYKFTDLLGYQAAGEDQYLISCANGPIGSRIT